MDQQITRGIDQLLSEARAVVPEIEAREAAALLDDPGVVFVDLRDIRELQRGGKLPGAFSCPRGMLEFWIDPASPYHKDIFARDAHFVFYCASAWRSALSAKVAIEMGLTPVSHIAGGFTAWQEAGLPVEAVERR